MPVVPLLLALPSHRGVPIARLLPECNVISSPGYSGSFTTPANAYLAHVAHRHAAWVAETVTQPDEISPLLADILPGTRDRPGTMHDRLHLRELSANLIASNSILYPQFCRFGCPNIADFASSFLQIIRCLIPLFGTSANIYPKVIQSSYTSKLAYPTAHWALWVVQGKCFSLQFVCAMNG